MVPVVVVVGLLGVGRTGGCGGGRGPCAGCKVREIDADVGISFVVVMPV